MSGISEVYKRSDGKWAFRIKAANGQVVATDGSQGYNSKVDARATLTKILAGDYRGKINELD